LTQGRLTQTCAGRNLKHKLDLVRVQEVRWKRCGTESAGEYTFFYGKENENYKSDTISIVSKKIILVVRG
jgi:hypothetical protein